MLSQASGYASAALGLIAAAGGKPVLVKEVAEAAGIPGAYLAKIVQALARKGLVITQRGVGGGVTLARPAAAISLLDVCSALEDPVVKQRCMLGTDECSDDRACPCHRFWTMHRAKYIDFLTSTTVADIAAFETRRRWTALLGTPPGLGPAVPASAGVPASNGTALAQPPAFAPAALPHANGVARPQHDPAAAAAHSAFAGTDAHLTGPDRDHQPLD
jgi:Rrf2 family protein